MDLGKAFILVNKVLLWIWGGKRGRVASPGCEGEINSSTSSGRFVKRKVSLYPVWTATRKGGHHCPRGHTWTFFLLLHSLRGGHLSGGKLATRGQMFPPPPRVARSCTKCTYTTVRRGEGTSFTKEASKRSRFAHLWQPPFPRESARHCEVSIKSYKDILVKLRQII